MEMPKRKLQKHLEPARPLRRLNVDQGDSGNADTRAQTQTPVDHQQNNITVEQFYNIIRLHKPKQGRISYTRDVLLELASSPVAKKKPDYLPEHPIVLDRALTNVIQFDSQLQPMRVFINRENLFISC